MALLDSLELQLRQQYPPALRWDNIEGGEAVVSGPAPVYDFDSGQHRFTLQPGESVSARIPRNSNLRFVSSAIGTGKPPVDFLLSRGLGLRFDAVPIPGEDGQSLLVVPPGRASHICTVSNPALATTPVTFSLFTSRYESLADIVPYRDDLALGGDRVVVSQKGTSAYTPFVAVQAGKSVSIEIAGQRRIKMESRVLYTDGVHERQREYAVHVRLDGKEFGTFQYVASPNEGQLTTAGGAFVPVGQSKVGYFDLPKGEHALSLSTTAPALVRLAALQSPDYLIPELNSPSPSPEALIEQGLPDGQLSSLWVVNSQDIAKVKGNPGSAPVLTERVSQRLARDNSMTDGGLLADTLLGQVVESHPAFGDMARVQAEIAGPSTSFRDLLPASSQSVQQRVYWSAPLRLKENTYRGMAIPKQLLTDSLRQIGDAIFTRLEAGTRLEYTIPKLPASSRLRVLALHPAKPVRLSLTMKSGAKYALELLPNVELAAVEYRPSLGEAALAVSGLRYPDLDTSTLGGPFSVRGYPALLASPAMVEIPLPTGIRQIVVQHEKEMDESVEIALQYLDSRQLALGESAYLSNLAALNGNGAAWELFKQNFNRKELQDTPVNHPLSSEEVARLDLANDWVSVIRLLHTLSARFSTGTTDMAGLYERNGLHARMHADNLAAVRSARKYLSQGELHLAIEDWAEAVRTAPESQKGSAIIELARTLNRAGESTLAVGLLKGVLLHGSDEAVAAMAYKELNEMFSGNGDRDGMLGMEAGLFAQNPGRNQLARVAVRLVESGYAAEGVKLGLLVPDLLDDVDSQLLSDAAMGEKWCDAGKTFDRMGNDALTGAMQLLARGYPREALPDFEAAGKAGQVYAQAIREGVNIQQRLRSPELAIRQQAVLDWEEWQWNHPGGRKEINFNQTVIEHGGSLMMKSRTRGLRSIAFIAGKGRPVKARFHGPLTVKVKARPIHSAKASEAVDGWLEVRTGNRLHLTPFNNNWPSAGLVFDGVEHCQPGQAVEFEKVFGPGLHEVEISGNEQSLGIQLYAFVPIVPIGLLPPLTPENVGNALAGRQVAPLVAADGGVWWNPGSEAIIYASEDGSEQQVKSVEVVEGLLGLAKGQDVPVDVWKKMEAFRAKQEHSVQQFYVVKIASFRNQAKAEELADTLYETGIKMSVVRLHDESGEEWFVVQSRPYKTSGGVRECAVQLREHNVDGQIGSISSEMLGSRIVAGYRPVEGCRVVSTADDIAEALAREDFDEALSLTNETTPEDVLTKLSVLVRLAETVPGRLIEAEAMAQELAARHQQVSDLKPLLQRLTGLTTWQPVASIQSSAGVRYVPVSSWKSESPYMRTRQALFGPVKEDEILLQGANPIAYIVDNPREQETVVLGLALPHPPYRKPVGAKMAWQVDDGTVFREELTPDKSQTTIRLLVKPGRHSLRVWIENPLRNQFVRVRLHTPGETGAFAASNLGLERRYHVATPEIPVVAAVKGPAWIRVDELRGERTVFSYRQIESGWHEIRLLPTYGDEGLFRMSVREVSPVGQFASIAPEVPDYVEVPASPFEMPTPSTPSSVSFHDGFELGGQEDGTWELETAAVKRRDVGEDTGGKDAEQFLQLSLRHRYYVESMPAYFKTEVLARKHEYGGPTIGLFEDFTYLPRSVPLTFNVAGKLYAQAPKSGDVYWGTGKTEWSASLRGRVSQKRDFNDKAYHVPSVSIFVRALSMNDDSDYKGKELDRDVYTDYKADHKIGGRIGDTLYYQPYLDSLLYGGASVTTNEQMNPFSPDNIAFRTGWSQLFGSFQTDIGYRYTHYLSDHDRAKSSNRDFVDAGVHWDYWSEQLDRFRVGLKTEYDLDLGQASGMFNFSWLWSNGRGLRDVRPGAEERFYDLKERALPSTTNNAVEYVVGE